MGSVLRSVGASQGNIWTVAPFIPVKMGSKNTKSAKNQKAPNRCCDQVAPQGSTHVQGDQKICIAALLGSNFTCISYKIGHQALPHCLWFSYQYHQLVLSCYLHQPESHQLSLHKGISDWQPDPTIGPQVYLGPIKICHVEKCQISVHETCGES